MLRRPATQRFSVALTLAIAVGACPAALAHAHPKSMEPAADASVSAPPEVSMFFTEALEPKFSSLQVLDDTGAVRSTAKSAVDPADPKHMTLALPKLSPGTYRVHWVTAATDGHRMDGEYHFSVK